jgi:hypothetical protein
MRLMMMLLPRLLLLQRCCCWMMSLRGGSDGHLSASMHPGAPASADGKAHFPSCGQ